VVQAHPPHRGCSRTCSAFLWACYTVAMRRARLGGLHAAAIAAVGALVLYLPAYAFFAGASLFKAPLTDIALQAFVQDLLTAVISLLLYGRAVSILGASSGAAFAALCPAMTALLAIPILNEWPSAMEWIAIISISTGVYVVSEGPLWTTDVRGSPRIHELSDDPQAIASPRHLPTRPALPSPFRSSHPSHIRN
jgi:threonine/homoserine efflux transporter RhtA